jgi:Spy/CpxP family protein refolding chaperone
MNERARISSEQLRGLMMHGEHLMEHIEERSARLSRLGAAAVNVLLGVCLGMLAAYALRFRWPMVDFNIVGPLMGGAGGALARLLSKDFKAQKRQERLRLEKLESASRLQMAGQIVEFLRAQGRQLPPDVKDGAWAEVHRLVSNQKGGRSAAPMLLGNLLQAPAQEKVDS